MSDAREQLAPMRDHDEAETAHGAAAPAPSSAAAAPAPSSAAAAPAPLSAASVPPNPGAPAGIPPSSGAVQQPQGVPYSGCCRHKETPRSLELQRDLHTRLNRVIGQLGGVKLMIEDNRYCGDVLTQLAAAESAVHSIAAVMLQDHLETCVVEQIRRGKVEVVDEVMQLMRKFSR